MDLFLCLLMSIIPSLILVYYFYKQDVKKPEPKGLVLKIFLLGILVTIPSAYLQSTIDQLINLLNCLPLVCNFVKAFFVAALFEQLVKLFIVFTFVYDNFHFDEEVDGIIYTIIAGLGLASLENFIYVGSSGFHIACTRALTAVPLNAISSGIMGYYVGKAKFSGTRTNKRSLIYKGIVMAVLIHGIYDFLLFEGSELGFISIIGIIYLLIIGFITLQDKIKKAIKEDERAGRHH